MTRNEAIRHLETYSTTMGSGQTTDDQHEEAKKMAIKALSEPKTGEWIKATGMMPPEFHGHHCCSECGNFANMEPPFGNREDLSRFCPNCGARMRGEEA